MRKRLFVDCDDTLVLYEDPVTKVLDSDMESSPHPYGYRYGQPYRVNAALVKSIRWVVFW